MSNASRTFPPDTDAHGSAIGETRPVPFATRPMLQGTLGMVAAGHYLAAAIGLSILEKGGNAVDAGVAAGFAVALLKPQSVGIGGEVPILIHMAEQQRSVAINGQGWAPRAATLQWFRDHHVDLIPSDGFLPATVPAQFAAWCTALQNFGTLSLAEVLGPAVDLAEGGFPMYTALRNGVLKVLERFKSEWPTSAAIYLRDGQPPVEGTLLRNPDWARTLKGAIDASLHAKANGREASIRAAIDYFYSGPVAQQAVAFSTTSACIDGSGEAHTGLLALQDFADFGMRGTQIEDPVRLEYHGVEVLKCGPWSQGPVFLQQLKLLEGFDLQQLGHNTANYLHVYLEATKLAFADRERYYGDPEFVDVPLGLLLSEDYAAERRELIDERQASLELRPGALAMAAAPRAGERWPVVSGDTTHVDAVDRWGNLFSATPSGGWIGSSPVVEGLGFPLGTRGQMFYLDSRHANALVPGKRPRTTLTPSLALRNGDPWLAFGTPGGDQQDQWTLQFFLNVVDFGMELQEALDAPTVQSTHFPGSFYPHASTPGGVRAESRIPADVLDELRSRGHKVSLDGPWSHGQVTAVAREANGVLSGAASPRGRVAYVMGR
ncbi:MAG: gamma-glutamyltransferase family protein [Chloroflexi bacterium]|nr:gamma-glutamyltransferase family protein [Chloroflexota bacterium]MBV9898150.1 gamma-glutamyltransferase family protein [Chloroflexota bacterium]